MLQSISVFLLCIQVLFELLVVALLLIVFVVKYAVVSQGLSAAASQSKFVKSLMCYQYRGGD